MTKELSLLSSCKPTAIAPAPGLAIAHIQLRDLLICPLERGVVNYGKLNSVVEQDLHAPRSTPRTLFDLSFTPANLASLEIPGSGATLFAAGGQDAELHLSLHHHSARRRRTGAIEWRFEDRLRASINNSILLTSLNLGRSNESSLEPRLAISNNDSSVKFFDVPMAVKGPVLPKIRDAGSVRLNVAVNHSSISPDGTCLLSVGDSSKVFLHRIYGGAQLSFTPITTLTIPAPDRDLPSYFSPSLAASFSTAFSRDGTKYAVASQEGVVCVWDVRSTKPLKVFQTDKSNNWGSLGNGMASGYLSDDPFDPSEWTRGHSKAPGWSARNVKFGNGGGNGCGKEIMTFTEHTSLLHVIDARTFETEEIIRVPTASKPRPASSLSSRRYTTAGSWTAQPRSSTRSHVRPYQRPASNARALAATIVNPSPRHIPVSATSHLSGPSSRRDSSQAPYVVLALEDTFRIPTRPSDPEGSSGSSTWGTRHRRETGSNNPEDDLVVIPPLGDREVEDDVRALLGSHGLRARRVGGVGVGVDGTDGNDYEEREEERMEVDELEAEWDCVSSRAPSRSSSPGPANSSGVGTRWRVRPGIEALGGATEHEMDVEGEEGATWDVDSPDSWMDSGEYSGNDGVAGQSNKFDPDLDIAGTCFDPTGGYIYVATPESVVEWNVRGSEKRWWSDAGNNWC